MSFQSESTNGNPVRKAGFGECTAYNFVGTVAASEGKIENS